MTWNIPGPGIEPVSTELAGDLPTAGPPGNSYAEVIDVNLIFFFFGLFQSLTWA